MRRYVGWSLAALALLALVGATTSPGYFRSLIVAGGAFVVEDDGTVTADLGSASSVSDDALSATVANLNAAETITGNWVNTTNPWADNEVADTLTIGSGSTMSAPPAIGGTTPNTGAFTTLSTTGAYSVVGASVINHTTSGEFDITQQVDSNFDLLSNGALRFWADANANGDTDFLWYSEGANVVMQFDTSATRLNIYNNLLVGGTGGTNSTIIANTPAGQTTGYYWSEAASTRWGLTKHSTSDDLILTRYPSGSAVESPITVDIDTGVVTLTDEPVAPSYMASAAAPYVDIYETDAGADAKRVRFHNESGVFHMAFWDDAGANSNSFLTVQRSGFTVSAITAAGPFSTSSTHDIEAGGDLVFGGHLRDDSPTGPTLTEKQTNVVATTYSGSRDTRGIINVTATGGAIAVGKICRVTFNTAFSGIPYVVLQASDVSSVAAPLYRLGVDAQSTTGFDIITEDAISEDDDTAITWIAIE